MKTMVNLVISFLSVFVFVNLSYAGLNKDFLMENLKISQDEAFEIAMKYIKEKSPKAGDFDFSIKDFIFLEEWYESSDGESYPYKPTNSDLTYTSKPVWLVLLFPKGGESFFKGRYVSSLTIDALSGKVLNGGAFKNLPKEYQKSPKISGEDFQDLLKNGKMNTMSSVDFLGVIGNKAYIKELKKPIFGKGDWKSQIRYTELADLEEDFRNKLLKE